ncbi:zinc finger MYM-type protein 1-like [Armigeres subalbatus]|uniref:zinc finger MYM-type protein 1-like n=1 Tax=Armigeres subalbatus TaxID=124917 RepID=UPI002ED116C7
MDIRKFFSNAATSKRKPKDIFEKASGSTISESQDDKQIMETHPVGASGSDEAAIMAAKNILENVPVNLQMVTAFAKQAEANRKIIKSIISTVLFCGTHDLPFRGKENHTGVFEDLIHFKAESGDTALYDHVSQGKKNATYLSPQIQNQIISICGDIVLAELLNDARNAAAYSILADESCDISGKEQLSIGVRFFDSRKKEIREEFLGFVELDAMDANAIATSIANFLQKTGLDPDKCVGQGYDGCSTMAGKDNGVQKRLREVYPKAVFVHCASHRLNLVVNDLNQVPQIRNAVSTVKDIINFFKESTIRRKYIPNIPSLCETRWSQKYKSISVFNANVDNIIEALETLADEGNVATRKNAYQLHSAATRSEFIFSLKLIAKYSALMEPVVNVMQGKSVDMLQCKKHIQNILCIVKKHRENAESVTKELLIEASSTAEAAGFEMTPPRTTQRQKHRDCALEVALWDVTKIIGNTLSVHRSGNGVKAGVAERVLHAYRNHCVVSISSSLLLGRFLSTREHLRQPIEDDPPQEFPNCVNQTYRPDSPAASLVLAAVPGYSTFLGSYPRPGTCGVPP